MGLLRRRREPPENAHGQRNIDGTYFTIWKCQRGHCEVGNPEEAPAGHCRQCAWDAVLKRGERRQRDEKTTWTVCTEGEAHAFLWQLEGPRMHDDVGYRVLS